MRHLLASLIALAIMSGTVPATAAAMSGAAPSQGRVLFQYGE